MSFSRLLILLPVFLLFTGCASSPMIVSDTTTVDRPAKSESQVVFMRNSFLGSAINASLYDVTTEQPVYLGIIANNTKVVYKTTPGKHTFMVVSEAADFLEADLSAGKTYYSLVTPRMGAWKARFSLWPIRNDPSAEFHTGSEEFRGWLNATKLAKLSEEAKAWYEKNKQSILKKQKEYWAVWMQKSEADKHERTLLPQDGS